LVSPEGARFPVHVFEAGAGSNAIMAAYHLVHALEKLEIAWNERAKADRHFKEVNHSINFNPGIIKGGDWAPACRPGAMSTVGSGAAGLVDRRMPEGDPGLRFGGGARPPLPLQQSAAGGMVGILSEAMSW